MTFNSMEQLLKARDEMRRDMSAHLASEHRLPSADFPVPRSIANPAALSSQDRETIFDNWTAHILSKDPMTWDAEEKGVLWHAIRRAYPGGY